MKHSHKQHNQTMNTIIDHGTSSCTIMNYSRAGNGLTDSLNIINNQCKQICKQPHKKHTIYSGLATPWPTSTL